MFKAGDKVKVTNVSEVSHGAEYFNEGDVSTVRYAGKYHGMDIVLVEVTKNADDPQIRSNGMDDGALMFVGDERNSLSLVEEVSKTSEGGETTVTLTKGELELLIAALGNTSPGELRGYVEEDFGADKAEELIPKSPNFAMILSGQDAPTKLFGKLQEAHGGASE